MFGFKKTHDVSQVVGVPPVIQSSIETTMTTMENLQVTTGDRRHHCAKEHGGLEETKLSSLPWMSPVKNTVNPPKIGHGQSQKKLRSCGDGALCQILGIFWCRSCFHSLICSFCIVVSRPNVSLSPWSDSTSLSSQGDRSNKQTASKTSMLSGNDTWQWKMAYVDITFP